MIRILLCAAVVAGSAWPSSAAPQFTCKASGDSWSVTGSIARRETCSVRCVLRDAAGNQDVVTCSPTLSPAEKVDPVCEGFLLGKRWTAASLVAEDCATVAPPP